MSRVVEVKHCAAAEVPWVCDVLHYMTFRLQPWHVPQVTPCNWEQRGVCCAEICYASHQLPDQLNCILSKVRSKENSCIISASTPSAASVQPSDQTQQCTCLLQLDSLAVAAVSGNTTLTQHTPGNFDGSNAHNDIGCRVQDVTLLAYSLTSSMAAT